MNRTIEAQPMLSDIENPIPVKVIQRNDSIRSEIQSLRALAIGFVLLFHIWPSWAPFGYLGVDVFFVISGYLMCRILSAKKPIDFSKSLDFYFRRIKRIVPLYLTVIAAVIIAARTIISPINYHQFVGDAVPSLFFGSNIPKEEKSAYFDAESKYLFFLHTWSLSAELQFYLFVPAIFALFDLFQRFRLSSLCIIIPAGAVSFLHQLFAEGDWRHLPLSARLWQFLCGFIAHYIHQRLSNKVPKNSSSLPSLILFFVLSAVLAFPLTVFDSQWNRLVAIGIATFVVARPLPVAGLLNSAVLVTIGDVSYSIYLLHWPLITFYRYSQQAESDDDQIPLDAGLLLITVSTILAYGLEKLFLRILRLITGWPILLFVLASGYALNGYLLLSLQRDAIRVEEGSDFGHIVGNSSLESPMSRFRDDLEILWDSRDQKTNFSKDQLISWNTNLANAQVNFEFCENRLTSVPTKADFNVSTFSKMAICQDRGMGTKNIVVIGNSHASYNYVGIRRFYRDAYKTLTLIMRHSCFPAPAKFQQGFKNGKEKAECERFAQTIIPALREWSDGPIDVIIALFAIAKGPKIEVPKNISTDPFYQSMQMFYGNLSEIATEAVIIQQTTPYFSKNPLHSLMSILKSGKDYRKLGAKREDLLKRIPGIPERMAAVKCPKCIKLDWINLWCNADSFCPIVDPRGVLNFVEEYHPSAFGALRQAFWMREKYDEYIDSKSGN